MAEIFNKKLIDLLKTDSRFLDDEGELVKAAIIDRAWKIDRDLVKLLLSEPEIEKRFFDEIEGHWIFNINTFIEYVSDKNFLANSYTRFRNKIGLNISGKFLRERGEVSLVWPYKDCVLEGGQTKEEEKRKEIFFNEILAQDEIDRLFDPKVLTNWKRYTVDGEQKVTEIKRDENGTIKENLIIKGNNLLALHTLKTQFMGKVKLIYIDPPYYFSDTKSGDTFLYNTNFKLSSWLVFMKNRLSIAKNLLAKEGTIFVQISDEGAAHIKLLLDEVFGSENFVNIISVRMKNIAGASGGGEDKKLKKNIEFIYIYSNNAEYFKSFQNVYDYKELYKLVQEYKENGVSWKYTSVLLDLGKKEYLMSTKDSKGNEIKIYRRKNPVFKSINQITKEESITAKEVYYKYLDKIFTTAMPQSSIRTRVLNKLNDKNEKGEFFSIEYTPRSGRNKGVLYEQFYKGDKLRLLSWLKDVSEEKEGVIYKKELQGTYWDGFNLNNLSREGKVELENGKKPEALLERILDIATDKNDIILDYHIGSGTTCAVAHKMGRQYIGIEQLDYGKNDSVVRLQNVIGQRKKDSLYEEYKNFDKSGISKSVKWQGGGDFIYFELRKYNEAFMNKIQYAESSEELVHLWKDIAENSFLNWYVNPEIPEEAIKDFIKIGKSENGLEKQKKLLAELLNKNQLYVNLSEIEDEDFNVSDEDKKLNQSFYKEV